MKLSRVTQLLILLAMALVVVSIYMIFSYAPIDRSYLGFGQKIFYFHVPLAWVGFLAFFVVFVGSILYMSKNDKKWELMSYASAQVGVVFTTLVLITGSIYGRLAWGPSFGWWNWQDVRLDTTLILWLLYLSYIMLGNSIKEEEKRGRFLAVFGIISFIDVPLVAFSIKLWSDKTLHPAIISKKGVGLDPKMLAALLVSIAAFTAIYVVFVLIRYQIGQLMEDIGRLKDDLGRSN